MTPLALLESDGAAATTSQAPSLDESFAACRRLAREHYENFPVGSWLLPRDRRRYVYPVYAFARLADDTADEGDLPQEERLARLDEWERKLEACYQGQADHPVFIALAETVRACNIPIGLLRDLLRAFRQDVTVHRYPTWEALLDEYCRYSANPVGRIVLRLFDHADPQLDELSDYICTALQLANFWQDVALDWKRGRVYIPQDDLMRFGVPEETLASGPAGARFVTLMEVLAGRTRILFEQGWLLCERTHGWPRAELRAVWWGGVTILDKLAAVEYDVFHRRPTLTRDDFANIVLKALAGIEPHEGSVL
jgi:squalene synthase HpnC